ncbi:MAG: EAL domain-containing protein (putative c-di-GMP-specific phosphodiesterase class I) [Alphaproteobacteria bacterium]|jgi:EAL domain-containing protein (putative c-di-GMP-specific phosphodiesterase class I)
MNTGHKSDKTMAKDLFPRALGVALLAVTAWIALSFINQSDQDKWLSRLNTANTKALSVFGKTIDMRLETSQKFARDSRLLPLFAEDFIVGDKPPKISRRAIYEFKYVNDVDHAYIFNTVYGEVLLSSAGSPDLPNRTLEPFYNAAKNKVDRLTNIAIIGAQTYIIFASSVRSPTGKIIGYAIYTDSSRSFFRDIVPALTAYPKVSFNAYMLEQDSAISIENFTIGASTMRIINKGKTIFPVFHSHFKPQKFTKLDGTDLLAVGGFLSDMPKWKVTTEIDMKEVNNASDEKRFMLFLALIFGVITLFLLPISGPYTNALKGVYAKIGLIKPRRSTPFIDNDSLDRMRYAAPPPLGSLSDSELLQNKISNENAKVKPKDDYRPSDSVIAYNIRTGMKNKRIKLLYQPIFNAQTNAIDMHEVYLRIIDDEGKIMQPSLWLPVAKSEDLFSLIDETVVTVAVEKFFLKAKPLKTPLAFNISGNTFSSLEFLQRLMTSSSSDYPIAENTIFELHSKEIIEDSRAMSFIKECREMGFRFSVDYFGGGPQTLKAAKTLKFDYVKIDILQFDIESEKGQKDFVKLIKTAESINLEIVVEKIEDERTLRFCKKVGVHHVQGYHLAEPTSELYKG